MIILHANTNTEYVGKLTELIFVDLIGIFMYISTPVSISSVGSFDSCYSTSVGIIL